MKIKIKGLNTFYLGIRKGLEEYQKELEAEYATAVQATAAQIASDARANLASVRLKKRGTRPLLGAGNWKLSKAIRDSKLKLYEDRHIIFQAVEPEGNKTPRPGTPAAYAWYQEHGWIVSADKIKRPRQNRLLLTDKRGRPRAKGAAYVRQKGKKFFERAAKKNLKRLNALISEINQKVILKIKGTGE